MIGRLNSLTCPRLGLRLDQEPGAGFSSTTIEAETCSGYGGLRQVELPKPQPAKDRVLVHVTAAGVTPLDHTILSGGHPRAKAPLVLGNEGAGVIEDAGDSGLTVGSRVMVHGAL